tara:strand:+ start:3025 stop:3756 length:732 start_codon:yes stop_codon:yes gene_type:complete
MAEVFTSDNSVSSEVMQARAEEQSESLQIGEEIESAHDAKLAGKYNSTEELESAYLQLQQKLGAQEDVQDEPEETDETDWLAEAYRSINESGELSDEVAQQLSEMNGMDVFYALQNADGPQSRDLSESELNNVFNAVGGQEQYSSLINWAGENFSEQEITAYDKVIDSGDMNQINLALQALYYRYTEAMGQEGELLQGKPAAAQSGYRSQQELIQAMNDPRYDNDPAYRNDVIEKLGRSELQF